MKYTESSGSVDILLYLWKTYRDFYMYMYISICISSISGIYAHHIDLVSFVTAVDLAPLFVITETVKMSLKVHVGDFREYVHRVQ